MKKFLLLVLPLVASLFLAGTAHAEIKFGVLANRGELETQKQWQPFVKYLTEQLGEPVVLVALPFAKSVESFASKNVDMLLSNPVMSLTVQEKHKGVSFLSLNTAEGTMFGGVILANKSSGITKMEDLKGKKVMSLNTDSAGGSVFQLYALKQKSVNKEDFAKLTIAQKQDDIVLAVKNGLFDAGFVRTGVLESMIAKGLVNKDDVLIVDNVKDSFPQVHSTALYPEWYIVRQEGFDAAKAEKIKAAALKLKPEDEAAKAAGIKGFVAPIDSSSLAQVLKDMKLEPFAQ